MRRRLTQRNQIDRVDVERLLASQRPWQDRAAAADVIIHNDGDLGRLQTLVEIELGRTLDAYRSSGLPESRWYVWRREQDARSANA